LNSELIAAEARRAELAPSPDSMDLYFQGLAWFNKGVRPDNVAPARRFFDRALAVDPDNVDALVWSARMDALPSLVTDRAAFATAGAKLIKALSAAPNYALAHMILGLVNIFAERALEGIANCEHALTLDRNLAYAHAYIGLGKIFVGRAEETESQIAEALRLSPRDTTAYLWFTVAGAAKRHLGDWEEAIVWSRRSIEANRNFPQSHFELAAALAQLGRQDEASSAVSAGLALNPTHSIARARALWTVESRSPTYLAQTERILESLRKAGLPEQ
jgi:tetratricopeptide (TPR) repeat protein